MGLAPVGPAGAGRWQLLPRAPMGIAGASTACTSSSGHGPAWPVTI